MQKQFQARTPWNTLDILATSAQPYTLPSHVFRHPDRFAARRTAVEANRKARKETQKQVQTLERLLAAIEAEDLEKTLAARDKWNESARAERYKLPPPGLVLSVFGYCLHCTPRRV